MQQAHLQGRGRGRKACARTACSPQPRLRPRLRAQGSPASWQPCGSRHGSRHSGSHSSSCRGPGTSPRQLQPSHAPALTAALLPPGQAPRTPRARTSPDQPALTHGAPHRMHSYSRSSLARSSLLCRHSLPSLWQQQGRFVRCAQADRGQQQLGPRLQRLPCPVHGPGPGTQQSHSRRGGGGLQVRLDLLVLRVRGRAGSAQGCRLAASGSPPRQAEQVQQALAQPAAAAINPARSRPL